MKFNKFSKKQLKILTWWATPQICEKYSAVIADGAIRSGKTMAMSLSFVLWAMTKFNGCDFAVCGKTVGSCRRNVIKPLLKLLQSRFKITDKRSENCITVSSGSVKNNFYIFGGKDESSQDLIQGITLAGVMLDEVALMPRSFVEQALGRCSVSGSRFWFNCNPENPRHWFKENWIDKAADKNALYLHFLMDDNPSLDSEIKKRYMTQWDGTFYRRYILGEWVIAEGLVYQSFNDDIANRLWRGNADELSGRYYISIDYGTLNPCSMGLWCVTDKCAVRIREYYYDGRKSGRQLTDEEYYSALEQLAAGKNIEYVVIDPSAASFIATIKRHNRFYVKKAKNDVLNGIRTTAQMLKRGIIQISADCTAAISEFGMYRWDEKSPNDTVIKENDHAMDDIRYFAYTILTNEFKYDDWG